MNKAGSAAKVKLNSFDDLFGASDMTVGTDQVQEIPLSELYEFKGHPFNVLDDEKMQLDTENGIGLIEKKRRGLGKPDIIYVKNFSTITDAKTEEKTDNADKSTEVQKLNLKKSNMHTSRSSEIELQEVQDLEHQKFTMQTSRGSESELAEVHKADPIYTNYNQTNQSYIDMSYTNPINQSGNENRSEKKIDVMDDVNAYIELIKDNIEYEHHMKYDDWQNKDLYEELFEVICEVVCVKRTTIRIVGEDYPYELVKSKFLKDRMLQPVLRWKRGMKR